MEKSAKAAKTEKQLKELGLPTEEIDYYLKLLAAGECSAPERLRILCEARRTRLDEIHRLEHQIIRIDTMKQEIRKK